MMFSLSCYTPRAPYIDSTFSYLVLFAFCLVFGDKPLHFFTCTFFLLNERNRNAIFNDLLQSIAVLFLSNCLFQEITGAAVRLPTSLPHPRGTLPAKLRPRRYLRGFSRDQWTNENISFVWPASRPHIVIVIGYVQLHSFPACGVHGMALRADAARIGTIGSPDSQSLVLAGV